jgi:hypothetical protein
VAIIPIKITIATFVMPITLVPSLSLSISPDPRGFDFPEYAAATMSAFGFARSTLKSLAMVDDSPRLASSAWKERR